MSDVALVMEIILRMTRDVRSINNYKKHNPPLRLKQYTPPTQMKLTLHVQPGVTHAQIMKQNSYAPINIEQDPHTIRPYQQTSVMQDIESMRQVLFEQMETLLNLLTTKKNSMA
jgi:hypothetical protein